MDPALIAGISDLLAITVGRCGHSGGPFPTLPQVAWCFPTTLPSWTPLESRGRPHPTGHQHRAGPWPAVALVSRISLAISNRHQGGESSLLITTDLINHARPLLLITWHIVNCSRTPRLCDVSLLG